MKTITVTAEELEVIRRVLERVDAQWSESDRDRGLIRPVAVAVLEGGYVEIGLGNGWQVTSGAFCYVTAEVAPAREAVEHAEDGRIDLRPAIEEAWAEEQAAMEARLAAGLPAFGMDAPEVLP